MPAFICHIPSGASIEQLLHYAQGINDGGFGQFTLGSKLPPDFPLSRITTPISLHYSSADKLADIIDVNRLIPKLKNSVVFTQALDKPNFNHADFVWGVNSASLIYSKILNIFEKHQ